MHREHGAVMPAYVSGSAPAMCVGTQRWGSGEGNIRSEVRPRPPFNYDESILPYPHLYNQLVRQQRKKYNISAVQRQPG